MLNMSQTLQMWAGVGNSLNVESFVTHHMSSGVADAANISWCRPVLWILNCL